VTEFNELVEKFKTKLKITQETQKYKDEVILPLINEIYDSEFVNVFNNLVDDLNERVGSKVVGFNADSKNRFTVEGMYHRLIFQKSRIEIYENLVSLNIVPLYIWKGTTKHIGIITMFLNPETNEVKWEIPFNNVKDYAIKLFDGLINDVDFGM